MSVPLDILTVLKPYFPPPGQVLGQGARINEDRWKEVATQTGDTEVTWVINNLSRPITRSNIIGLRDPDPVARRRRVVIASLMWGYGITGTRWGSWVTDISNFLGPGLDLVLADCEAHLTAGRISEAYELFTHPGPGNIAEERYHGIGIPYITKILYFLARNSPKDALAEYPLILDTRVSMALAQLTGYRLLVRPADYRPRPDSTAYVRYVTAMHAWASRLNMLPEVIEYYFWAEAIKPDSPLWTACRAQYGPEFP